MSRHCDEQPSTDSSCTPSDTENNHEEQEGYSCSAFLNKLYKMLEDKTVEHLIFWSEEGDQFGISNPIIFSKEVLPKYFKHNKWQSFVRQLNMYDFHKVNSSFSNVNPSSQSWDFKHPSFKRGDIDGLRLIKRKSAKPQLTNIIRRLSSSLSTDNIDDESVYSHILHIEESLRQVNLSCDALRSETSTLKSLIIKQQEALNSISGILINMLDENEQSSSSQNRREYIDTKLKELQGFFDESFCKLDSFVYEHCFSIKPNLPSKNSIQASDIAKRYSFGKESHLLNHSTTEYDDDNSVDERRID